MDTIREPLLVQDNSLCVVAASGSFYRTFGLEPHEVERRPVYDLGGSQWNIPALRVLLETILPQQAVMEAYDVERDFSGIGRPLDAPECPHRVSSSLQIIASILSLKAQAVQSEEIRQHLQDAHPRVLSVAAVQR